MADISKTISIIFEGDDRVGKTITGISSGLDSLGSKAVTATQPLADMAEKALMLEGALVALTAGGLALAINQAGQFGDSFAEISTLIDDSSSNIDAFSSNILDYSKNSSKSISDINAAVYSAISAGVDYKDSLGVLSEAEKLSIAGKADLESTLVLLVSTLNAYGAGVDEATAYSDSFFKTVKLGQTTLPELADNLFNVSTIAAQLGVPIETVNSAIAALTKQGVPTSQAITQISGAFTAFLKPSSQAQEIAKELGIEFNSAALKSKGFENVLWEVYQATGGNEEIMAKLFGRVEGLRAALSLGKDEAGFFKDALEEMQNSAGATEAAYAKMADNFALANQKLVNNLQTTLIQVGQPLQDEYGEIVDALVNMFQGLQLGINDGAFDPIFATLEEFSDNAVAFFNGIAKSLPEALEQLDFSKFIQSIEGLGSEVEGLFNALFGDIDLTTPEGLAEFIQKVVDGVTALQNVVGGILGAWEPFLKALGEGIDKFSESDSEIQKLVGTILGWGQVVNTVAGHIGALTGALNLVGGAMSVLAVTNIAKLISGMTGLASTAAKVGLGLTQFTAVLAAPVGGYYLGKYLYDNIPIVKSFGDAIGELAFDIVNYGDSDQDAFEKQAKLTEAMGDAAVEAVKLAQGINDIPEEKTTVWTQQEIDETLAIFEKVNKELQGIPEQKTTVYTAEVDDVGIEIAKDIFQKTLPDESIVLIQAKTDAASIDTVKGEIDKLPKEKELELILKGEIDKEIARITSLAETVQTSIEWEAKIDIAEVEAAAEIIMTLSNDISSMFENTGDVISSLVGSMGDLTGLDKLHVEELIAQESKNRAELLATEVALSQSQIDYMNARTAALKNGQGLVTIQADNLEPELQLVLHKIIQLTQIQANEEGLEFLIGV